MQNKLKKPLRPCPDPDRYILVQTREGSFWRRKRGSVKPVVLNEIFRKNAEISKVSGPFASRLSRAIAPYIYGLNTGRLTLRFNNAFRKSLNEDGTIHFLNLNGLDVQVDYPLHNILRTHHHLIKQDSHIIVRIPLGKGLVKRQNQLVSHFYFELILLTLNRNDIEISNSISPLYAFDDEMNAECSIVQQVPIADCYLLFLKLSSLENNEPAHHPKHYGMKVIAAW